MLAHFYIPMPKNDMKLAVQKNHLGVKFCPEPVKKRRHYFKTAISIPLQGRPSKRTNF